jgi:hypothetical protein
MNETLRAADRDRDEVGAVLREQYAQGRLTLEEFEERSTTAMSARTMGELRALTADLPATPPPAQAAWSPSRMRLITAAGVGAAAAVLTIALVAGHVMLAWPSWVVLLVVLKLTHGRRRLAGQRVRRG